MDQAQSSCCSAPSTTTDNINTILRSLSSQAKTSLASAVAEIIPTWGPVIRDLFHNCFEPWSKNVGDTNAADDVLRLCQKDDDAHMEEVGAPITQDAASFVTKEIEPSLESRSGTLLSLGQISGSTMCPIRAAKSSALTVKMSDEPSTDRIKKALLSKNAIMRSVIASDSRGRLVIAEPSSLL